MKSEMFKRERRGMEDTLVKVKIMFYVSKLFAVLPLSLFGRGYLGINEGVEYSV